MHEEIKFECKFCGLKFSQEGYLKRHIKSKHAAVSQSKETLDTDYGFKSEASCEQGTKSKETVKSLNTDNDYGFKSEVFD